MENKVIIPQGINLLVKPYRVNPYEYKEDLSLLDITDAEAKFRNPDSGDEEVQKRGLIVATVIAAGPDCKQIKVNDDVMYYYGSSMPIPYLGEAYEAIAEQRILMVVR